MIAAALADIPLHEAGRRLAVYLPHDTPRCCAHHAVNHVRHVGTAYDALRQAHGRHLRGLEYLTLRADVDARVRAELMYRGRLPRREQCSNRLLSRVAQKSTDQDNDSEQPVVSAWYSEGSTAG